MPATVTPETVTPETAVAMIRPGARVYVASLAGTPLALLEALLASGRPDVELVYFLVADTDPQTMIERAPHVRHRPIFLGRPLARAALADAISYVPISLPQAAEQIRAGRWRFDAVLTATTAADDEGYLGLGPEVGMTADALATGAPAFAEIVPALPAVHGAPRYPRARFAALVSGDRPLPEYAHPRNDEAAQRIGRYLARLIEDGSTLQVGPGRVANGALRYLGERLHLRLRTDVLYEEALDLLESGAVAASAEEPVVASHAAGTRRLFDRIARDPAFRFAPIGEVADEAALAATPRLVSITQAFAIDLTGQACCDSFGDALLGGLASQPEFMRGAARSPGGKAILCLYATDASGGSAIRGLLRPGEPVTLARADVHFVVTEYGIAYLHGKSLRARALALIEVAAPAARADLLAQARELGLLSQQFRRTNRDAYAIEDERGHAAADGRRARIRPARLRDVPDLQRLVHRLPQRDLYLRFFRTLRSLSIEDAVRLCTADQGLDVALVATEGEFENESVIASACLFTEPTTGLGEVAYLVDQRWRGTGLGRALQRVLMVKARALGLRGMHAQALADNERMLALARASGTRISITREGELCNILMLFD